MQSPPELGHSIAARRIFLVDPEHSMLVGVKRDRLAITIQIGPRRLEIIKRRLRLHKLQMHQPARRVVDIDQQRALRLLSQPFREVTFCASYKSHWFGELW